MTKIFTTCLLVSVLTAISSGLVLKPAASLSCIATPVLSNLDPRQPLIIGKIQSLEPDGSITVSVQETLAGNVDKDVIRIDSRSFVYWWGGQSAFPDQSQWVFRLDPSNHTGFDFSLSPCLNPPKVSGTEVSGLLSEPTSETMTLNEFRNRVLETVR